MTYRESLGKGAAERVVARVRADVADGSLAALAADLGIDLMVLFGSAVDDARTAGDVDLAYSRDREATPVPHLDVVNALIERYGDAVDVLDLDAAGSVARFEALHGIELLVQGRPGRYAEAQMAAAGAYRDTQRLRDQVVAVLAS